MQLVEQAVFTLPENEAGGGYRIVAASDGVHESDLGELSAWGPGRDSLLAANAAAESLNFHPLPSGSHCLSRSVAVSRNQGDWTVLTHSLVVPPGVLARFGNNPFALAREVARRDMWLNVLPANERLETIKLGGGAVAVDQTLLKNLVAETGAEVVAACVQAARDALCLAVGPAPQPATMIAGIINCLPVECRPEFSFSTRLKFSPRRPFRLVALSDDPAERHWTAGYPNVEVFAADNREAIAGRPLDGWSRLIQRALAGGEIDFLAMQLSKRRFSLAAADLPALGLQLLEELDAMELGSPRRGQYAGGAMASSARAAHAAHQRFAKSIPTAAAPLATAAERAAWLDLSTPEVVDKLEQLDDLVYDAIAGQPGALVRLREQWPRLLAELDERLTAESREQYLRYALSVWEQCAAIDGLRHADRAIQALDVLCLLFGEE
jgi:hypothetical protein